MVKKYITWIAPAPEEEFTHVEIWKSVNQGVSWEEFTTDNDPDYGLDGIVVTRTYAIDNLGDSGHWYKLRFYDNDAGSVPPNPVYSDWSDFMRGSDFRGYCTIKDVRDYTNIQSPEYSDAAIQMLIDTITAYIDSVTNRTWQGVTTVTDEHLDGNGTNYLTIQIPDLRVVTSLSIDQSGTGDFQLIPPEDYHVYIDRGGILLRESIFPNRRNRVLISYTHGNPDPTTSVRHLCILLVSNMIRMDASRAVMIEELKQKLLVGYYSNTPVGRFR